VLAAPTEDIGQVIRSSGFFRIKAERIKAALSAILERTGRLDLSFLSGMPVEDAKSWLTSLYGVGPKTAAIVLLFSFGMPALPVDTHVWRVAKRLGLIERNTSRERAHVLLEAMVPKTCVLSLNEHLVRHGREICLSRRPSCDMCFLSGVCDYAREQKVR
jgi:endonuclease-3